MSIKVLLHHLHFLHENQTRPSFLIRFRSVFTRQNKCINEWYLMKDKFLPSCINSSNDLSYCIQLSNRIILTHHHKYEIFSHFILAGVQIFGSFYIELYDISHETKIWKQLSILIYSIYISKKIFNYEVNDTI